MYFDQKRKLYHKKILRMDLLFILFSLVTIISCEDSSTEPETAFIDNSNEYDNTIIVSTPEVFELFNISISLTDFGLHDAYYVAKNSEYYNDVQSQFGRYKTHSFIEFITEFSSQDFAESNTETANYNNVKVASFFFELDYDSLRIMPEAYSLLPDSLHYLIQQFSIAANQFMKQSDFITFYNNHKSLYENKVSKFKAAIPAMSMRKWLETQFSRTYPLY